MADKATGAMARFGPSSGGPTAAGLVLLYADAFKALPAVFGLSRETAIVGREAPATIVVPVHAVSRQHAEIAWERGGFVLSDKGSTNGTFVDGRRVSEVRLEHG